MSRVRLLSLICAVCTATAQAHTDVSETIKALTAEIAVALAEAPEGQDALADLYFRRATEYRALRESEHAREDLETALRLAPEHRLATIALIQQSGTRPRALELIKKYASFADDVAGQFEATFLLARHHHASGQPTIALFLCEGLQQLRLDQDPALDLLHAHILRDLDRPREAAAVLKKSWQSTGSIVLRNTWIDASLTAAQPNEVIPIIEKEIFSSRFRSSWLIRRARAALILGDAPQARRDLTAALSELAPRIRPSRPDLTLIADRGLAHALLGNREAAAADLALLKQSALPPDSYRLLSDALTKPL